MKALIASPLATALLALAPALALAQAAPAKPAAKAAAKPAATAKRPAKLAPAAQKAVEEATPIDDDLMVQLSETELEIARKVYVGYMPCELGAAVTVMPARREGFFLVTTKGHRFFMHPAESRTGAIRLEDPKRGALWLQLGNKSMLMSQKLGQRLADECMNPAQQAVAEAMRKNPPQSILEPQARPAPNLPAPAAAATAAVATTAPAAMPAASAASAAQ